MSAPDHSGYNALRQGAAAARIERDFLRVSGPDATEYLQGQLSQDVNGIEIGGARLTLLLEPQGKLVAFARVSRVAEQDWVLDCDRGGGEPMLERLRRFRLRTKVDIEAISDWSCIALRGPGAAGLVLDAGADGVVAHFDWPPLAGPDLMGPGPAVPEGATLCTASDWEAARIEAGLPQLGLDIDAKTIPEEAGLVASSVSFTKGCYTGQELVARIDSRGGNVPRRLRGIVCDAPVPVGAELLVGDQVAGVVTSSGLSPALGPVGLAYLKRGHDVPVPVILRWPDGEAAGEARALPLVGPDDS